MRHLGREGWSRRGDNHRVPMWTTPRAAGCALASGATAPAAAGAGWCRRLGIAPELGRPGGFLPWPTGCPARRPRRHPCTAEAYAAAATWSSMPPGAAGRPASSAGARPRATWSGRAGRPGGLLARLAARCEPTGTLACMGHLRLGDRTPGGLPPVADVLPCATCGLRRRSLAGPLHRLPCPGASRLADQSPGSSSSSTTYSVSTRATPGDQRVARLGGHPGGQWPARALPIGPLGRPGGSLPRPTGSPARPLARLGHCRVDHLPRPGDSRLAVQPPGPSSLPATCSCSTRSSGGVQADHATGADV